MVMPHQIRVTIRAPAAAERVPELRQWLAEAGKKGLAEASFGFAGCRGLHSARFYLLEETADLAGRPIPASLVFMSEVDAPLRRHLAELADVAKDGVDQAFQHCPGYPGPGGRPPHRLAPLPPHPIPAT